MVAWAHTSASVIPSWVRDCASQRANAASVDSGVCGLDGRVSKVTHWDSLATIHGEGVWPGWACCQASISSDTRPVI